MNRRSLFGLVALSPIMAVEAFAKEKPTGEPIPEATRIIIQGTKKKQIKPPSPSQVLMSDGKGGMKWGPSPYSVSGLSMGETDATKQVSMAVGEDGNLWLKSKDGDWKRVVTE